ncbi:hypothetical protein OUZ56_009815 [Daphnia magna]|uniref:MULE transposase domain-containing protein n=1 Tax=Daphnia magna TaxID=35525 RepID=A0ABR0AGZ8_9CRUS|nr:hypothetical protein OUZ56_009815 [Daphnia magna]
MCVFVVENARLAPEALQLAKDTVTAGIQPARVRKLLQDKFGSHLISKDLINLKQTLAGNTGDEWKDTVDLLLDLRKDPNNVISVSYDGDGEVAAIFIQLEKTTETNNDVSVTKVTMTDKDCSEISALEKYFPDAEHILCHFHVLKAVDAWLNTLKEIDGVNKERKNDIREKFRKVLYTGTNIELDTAKARLYEASIIPSRKSSERIGLVDIVRISLSDSQLMQKIREVKFSRQRKHPLLEKFAASISPFAWGKITENMKYMRKSYDFKYHQESSTYQISSSNNKSYTLQKDLTGCSYILASVTSPTRVHKKEKARKPVTEREQFNTATLLFRKIAETINGSAIKNPTQETSSPVSENSEFDNDVKIPDRKTITKNPHECSSPVSEENEPDPTEKGISSEWSSFRLPVALKKRGRPKNNNGYFNSFHQRKKARIAQPSSVLDELLEEENMIREEEDRMYAKEEDVALTEAVNDSSIIISDVPMEPTETKTEDAMDSSTISDTPVEIPATTSPVKKPKRKTRVGHQHLFVDKVEELTSKNQLTSGYINMAQMMMKKNNPDIGGLFCVTIGGSLEFPKTPPKGMHGSWKLNPIPINPKSLKQACGHHSKITCYVSLQKDLVQIEIRTVGPDRM